MCMRTGQLIMPGWWLRKYQLFTSMWKKKSQCFWASISQMLVKHICIFFLLLEFIFLFCYLTESFSQKIFLWDGYHFIRDIGRIINLFQAEIFKCKSISKSWEVHKCYFLETKNLLKKCIQGMYYLERKGNLITKHRFWSTKCIFYIHFD